MKLLDIIWKEISVVKSQKIAILLIVLYPLLAITLLGGAMSGTNLASMNLSLGYVDNLEHDSEFIGQISENKNISLIEFEDSNKLIDAVIQKDVVVGLVMNSQSQNQQILIDLYYDNSNLAAGQTFKEFAKVNMQLFALSKTKDVLHEVWTTISSLGTNIEGQVNQIEEFKTKLNEAGTELDKLETKLNMLDFDEIEGTLDSQSEQIDTFEQKNQSFKQELNDFKESFDEVKAEIEQIDSDFSDYKSDLDLVSTQLGAMIVATEELINNTPEGETKNQLISQKEDLQNSKNKVDAIINALNEVSDESSDLNTKLNEADSLFQRLEQESSEVSSALNNSNASIEEMNQKLIVFKDAVDEVRDLLVEARASKVEIEGKLNSSSELMGTFSEQIVEFNKIDPEVIAQPIRIYEKRLFSPKFQSMALLLMDPLIIGGIVSNAISIVLILTCLLLTAIIVILERKEKVALRLMLSPSSKGILVFGKIIGQLLIALLEALIIYLIAIFVFGLDLFPIIPELFIATSLIACAFICLGLLISAFTKTQSTAILLSLLAVVPMLFLSGIIIPLDLMSPIMQKVSEMLPLTASNNLLIGLIIKGIPLTGLINEILVLIMIIIIGLLAVFMRKDF
jgi:ABC-type multidrug transport system permease subunit/uncharacterized coiled-coil DUF342 family protein